MRMSRERFLSWEVMMRNLSCLPLLLLAVPLAVAGESRVSGSVDTSRHPDKDSADREWIPHRTPLVVVPRPDPAVEYFWSDRCVGQRRYGTSHTGDCDNPAYTGVYPYGAPYANPYGYQPYRPYSGATHAPRGRILIER